MNNFDINKFNDFINSANQVLSCGPSCQQEKKNEDLKQKYLDAKSNLVTAPTQLEKATQEYITFTQGESGYNEYIEKTLKSKADHISDVYLNKFNNEFKIINTEIDSYGGLTINFNNIIELLKKYKVENQTLENKIKSMSSNIITNDRKTYYEDQSNGDLRYYFILLLIIYYIFVAIYAYYKSNNNFKTHIVIIFLMIIYPFIGSFIIGYIIFVIHKIISLFPQNVYINL